MFSHQDLLTVNPFIQIETGQTQLLHVSAGHYLWATPRLSSAAPGMYRAADLRAGDCLWTLGRNTTTQHGLVCARITVAKPTQAVGLYNPHTPSGSVIVNGIAATTFTDVLPASLQMHQLVTFPARLLYRMLFFKCARQSINKLILAIYFKLPNIGTHLLPALMRIK